MGFTDLVNSLTKEEEREILKYINYYREVLSQGYRPVIASSKGSVTKILNGDVASFSEFLDELLKSDILATLEREDPLLKAKLRGVKAKQEMLNYQGQSWKSVDVANYFGISVQAVSKQRASGKILGLSLGTSGYRFPSWQFVDDGILPGLSKTLSALETNLVPDWDKLRFLITGDFKLNGLTPVECLQNAELEPVLSAALSYGLHSAA
jgi:hypothetical protein